MKYIHRYCMAAIIFSAALFGCAKSVDDAQTLARKADALKDQAIAMYQRAVEQGKDLAENHFNLGMLYYGKAEFEKAIREFTVSGTIQAKKFLGIALYKVGNYTDALDVFRNIDTLDDAEYRYYYGLTCEKLNLYEQALDLYAKIVAGQQSIYQEKARERSATISRSKLEFALTDADGLVKTIIQNAPQAERYPQAGAAILLADETMEVSPQNTMVAESHMLIKIFNDRGKEDFSEIQTEYDSTFEKVELVYARIIKPDGKVVEVGSRHIRDVSKYLNFPLYSNVRVHIISFPEVTEGAVLEYKIRVVQNQLINKKDFAFSYPLQMSEPVLAAKFTLTLPKDRRLFTKILNEHYNTFRADLAGKMSEGVDTKTYSWEFKDIPQVIPEPQMPPGSEINPMIMFSTFSSWDEIYQWWWKLAKDKIKINPAIQKKVAQLTQGLSTPEEKARAIHNFCAKDIRYVAVEYGQAGHEPHSAEEIFLNKYGDCKDQAILLVTMLREIGLKAYPVLISTKDNLNLHDDFPSIQFNHAIACVELDGKFIFMDPTAQTCAFRDLPVDDQARRVLVFTDDGYKILPTPLFEAEKNLVSDDLRLRVHADGTIQAKKEVHTFGYFDQARRYWFLFTPPQLVEETLKEKIQEVCVGAVLTGYEAQNANDLTKPTVLTYSFTGSDYFITAGELYIAPQLSALDMSTIAKEERRYPIDFGFLNMQQKSVEIELPRNFKVKFLPKSFTKESPWFSVKTEFSFKNNTVVFKETRQIKKSAVALAEYAEYKKFMEGLAKALKQRIVLEKVQ